MNIWKPSEEDLKPILEQATAGTTVEEWREKFLANLKALLLREPIRYRAFGPYWWAVKKIFIDLLDFSFGEEIDLEWAEALDYGKPELNLLAAFAYEEQRLAASLVDDPFHVLETADGEDAVEFASSDPEMEIMAIGV